MAISDKEGAFSEREAPDVTKTAGKDNPNDSDIQKNLNDLTDRIAKIEDKQNLKTETIIEVQNYVADLRKDANSIREIRLWWGIIPSMAYIFLVNIAVFALIFCHPLYFTILGSYTRVSFVIVAVSSSIGLFITVLRGAFKTYDERHKNDLLPPNLQAIIEVFKNAAENSGKKQ